MLVDQQCDRDHLHTKEIQWIDEDRPLHLLPLHEQLSPFGMLFLDDAQHLELAGILKLFGCFVPPGHVTPTACSP